MIEGDTGFDPTFARGGEPTPLPIFGYVQPLRNGQRLSNNLSVTGAISGTVVGIKSYTPPKGGSFDFWGGVTGTKVGEPIDHPWLSLVDLQGNDTAVWVGQGNQDGSFNIAGVPDGNYSLTWWDEPQDYNVNFINVTVSGGEVVQMGNLPLNGWWTRFEGYVFDDANRNGVKDPGEGGHPDFTLTLRQKANSLMERGHADRDDRRQRLLLLRERLSHRRVVRPGGVQRQLLHHRGHLPNGQPAASHHGQGRRRGRQRPADHRPQRPHGLGCARLRPDGANSVDPQNGGIVGTVSYDVTRNEVDPQYAATEDWQPGISGVPVELARAGSLSHQREPAL